jgi:tripartite-type tricarboxylate transporter receptor subunit TctC
VNRYKGILTRSVIFMAVFFLTATFAFAQSFYQGKTITLIVPYTPGASSDLQARVLAANLGKHIPGNPNINVKNLPGANGLLGANEIYKVASRDGLTMGLFPGRLVFSQIFGDRNIRFDARSLKWIGALTIGHPVCAGTGVDNVRDWMSRTRPVTMAGAKDSVSSWVPRLLREAIGLRTKVIEEFKTTTSAIVATLQGATNGVCFNWTRSISRRVKNLRVVVQATPTTDPDLQTVPLAEKFAHTDRQRQLLQYGIYDYAALERVYSLPPDTDVARVEELRRAFLSTLRDQTFLAQAEKVNLDTRPLSGEKVEATVKNIFQMSPSLIRDLKSILDI